MKGIKSLYHGKALAQGLWLTGALGVLRCIPLYLMHLLGWVMFLLLAGCASHPAPEKATKDQPNWYQTSAYRSAQQYGVQAGQGFWSLPSGSVEVAWLVPQGRAVAPLILYFPGLGETAQAGARWRQTWAEAGYAVLSVQVPAYGMAVYASKEARAGVFQPIARRAFGAEALAHRHALATEALAYLNQRIRAGDLHFAPIDSSRVAVAGFDLGAQTAAHLAMETNSASADGARLRPLAVLLLSPYVAADADEASFARIQAPVLSITGPRDEDPFSWVASPQVRLKLWQGLQASGSYHLWLTEATHATLSGLVSEGFGSPNGPPATSVAKSGAPPSPSRMGPGGGRGGNSGGRPEDGGQQGGRGGPPNERSQTEKLGITREDSVNARQGLAIQSISVAFLDARVAKDSAAALWLDQKARAWLDGQGSLAVK